MHYVRKIITLSDIILVQIDVPQILSTSQSPYFKMRCAGQGQTYTPLHCNAICLMAKMVDVCQSDYLEVMNHFKLLNYTST